MSDVESLRIGLDALIAPYSTDEFFDQAWPGQPFVVHSLDETIRPLTKLPFLRSVEAMLGAWPKTVRAHLPDVADESSAVDASPKDAAKLFANKMGLLFNNVETISPELSTWLARLKKDLGLPTSTYARCMVYATPDGKGTAAHFDQNVNFVLQLSGTKTWRLSENESVYNPTQRFTIGQPLDPELESYAHDVMPDRMPEEAEEIVLKPGSMLFVPRGYWHATEASGNALALNFTFSQPTWVDLFTAALRSRLLLSPEWRELADGVGSQVSDRRAVAEQKLAGLLAELAEDVPQWRAEDILAATEGTPPKAE
jgi:50S ribosomal protein L16 3-hydroxylase